MRPTCTFCARKHLGQASALLVESRMGYPEHLWLAIGHLAEASEEMLGDYPAIADEIRDHRKRLEIDPAYEVPVLALISKISVLDQPGTTPPAVVVAPDRIAQAMSECAPCEKAKQEGRRAAAKAECALIGPDLPYRGRLIIMASLANFEPSYSLCSVILDQAHAARLTGYRVHVWVNRGCDVSKLPPMPPGLTVEDVLPSLPLEHDRVVEDNVAKLVESIELEFTPMCAGSDFSKPRVITHDFVFQAWYIDYAVAMHRLADRGLGWTDGSRWWHMVHSSVGARPDESVAQWRARLPAGHNLLAVNYADVPYLRGYYQIRPNEVERVATLLNPRDPRSFLRMTGDASLIITRYSLLQRDVVQVYPVSGTRMMEKGLDKLVVLFGAMARAGASVALVVANAHSNNDDAKHAIKHLRSVAATVELPEQSLIFTSEVLPQREATGLDGDSVRSLFSISNLFAFPTVSEAGSLVLLEAMLSQCLLVLNDSLPCLADYVSRTTGMWVPWGSVKGVARPFNVDEVAAQVLERLDSDDRLVARRAVFDRSSIEAYGANLLRLLGPEVEDVVAS